MFQRIAAQPLALTAALFFFPACDDADGDGGETETAASTSGATEQGTTADGETDATETTPASESGDESGSTSTGDPAGAYADLYGKYLDNFGGSHTLSAEGWTQAYMGMDPFTLVIEQVDDDLQWVAGVEGEAGTYGRHDWAVDDDGQLRLCTGAFSEATLQDAIDAAPSDATDFDGVGCGGMFGWSVLTPAE